MKRLSAVQAQQHPWFALNLGWEAESLRIAAQLPHLIDQVRTNFAIARMHDMGPCMGLPRYVVTYHLLLVAFYLLSAS